MFINHFVYKICVYSLHYFSKPLTPIVRLDIWTHQHGVRYTGPVRNRKQQSTIAILSCAPFVITALLMFFLLPLPLQRITLSYGFTRVHDDYTLVVAYSRKCTIFVENLTIWPTLSTRAWQWWYRLIWKVSGDNFYSLKFFFIIF